MYNQKAADKREVFKARLLKLFSKCRLSFSQINAVPIEVIAELETLSDAELNLLIKRRADFDDVFAKMLGKKTLDDFAQYKISGPVNAYWGEWMFPTPKLRDEFIKKFTPTTYSDPVEDGDYILTLYPEAGDAQDETSFKDYDVVTDAPVKW
jgi:hypothetical protein